MSKVRFRLITILSLVVLAAVVFGLVIGTPRGASAGAVDYAPTTVFTQGTGGDVGASPAEEEETSYIRFSFRNNGSVYFRRDLALKWFEGASAAGAALTPDEGGLAAPGQARHFSMTFAFAPAAYSTREEGGTTYKICPQCGKDDLAEAAETCTDCAFSFTDAVLFDRFEILFESAEENITKDAKATNSIVFAGQDDGSVKVGVKDAAWHTEHADDEEDTFEPEQTIPAADAVQDIKLALGEEECAPGEFALTLTAGETTLTLGKFTNIGGNFLEYRSSASTTPSTPITFKMKLPAAEEGKTSPNQQVLMKELNGQTFELTDGRVQDNAPAALVLNEEIYGFTLGQRFSLSYEVIDVCKDSITPTRSFYMIRTEDDDDSLVHIPTNADYASLTTSSYFMPSADSDKLVGYVSIRFLLKDGRYENDDDYEPVYLSWYVAKDREDAVATFVNGEDKIDGILVDCVEDREKPVGPYYVGLTATASSSTNVPDGETLKGEQEKYQALLEGIAAKETTSAGNGAYFYLPSLRGLISSNYADYRNLRFSISYKKENSGTSASSETSLRYNNLRFEIDLEGRYSFKIIASDAAGNAMKYYLDGELVDVTSTNVWDIDEIPEFHFTVDYKGADIKDPGEQDLASRGTQYNVNEFEIVDLGDSIKEYTLIYFDMSKFPEEETAPAYSDFVKDAEKYTEGEAYEECRREIKTFNSDIEEDDPAWSEKTDNDYHWEPDSLTFVPQESGFYVVKLTYYDLHKLDGGKPASQCKYQVIEARNPYDYIPTQTDWLANNVTSVVLFSISAVLAVAIVVLFVVKPSDKKVEEVDLDKLKGKKK